MLVRYIHLYPVRAKLVADMDTLDRYAYYWCSCGKSGNITFCDDVHTGTEFVPVEFTITEKKEAALCSCQKRKMRRSATVNIRTHSKGGRK